MSIHRGLKDRKLLKMKITLPPNVTVELARHFTAKDIPGVPVSNQYRHLHFPDAERQANAFRDMLAKELPGVVLTGHSVAIRAKYSLLLTTIGILNGIEAVEIPNLFPLDDEDGKAMMAACKITLNPSKWETTAQEALKRFGFAGAKAILETIMGRGIANGTVRIFTHGPMVNSQAAFLAGGDEELVAHLFAINTKEGDRFIIRDNEVTYVPLVY